MGSGYFNIQGHRGARGHFPENTIPGFIGAIQSGVHTLELDVVISKDQQVLVSHEAWMNDVICSLPDGTPIKPGKGKDYNLYQMSYIEIKQFDCGRRGHPEFPRQAPLPAHKPLLSEVFIVVEKYTLENNLPSVNYNIELKTDVPDGIFNPSPSSFVDLVYRETTRYLPFHRFNIQSFDLRLLKEVRTKDAQVKIGILVENPDGLDVNLEQLGFKPDIYSPDFALVDEVLVKNVHAKKIKLIPWTVNETKDMKKLIALGVDGIITDYPDRLVELVKHKN